MSITGCRNDGLVKLLNGMGLQPLVLPRTGLTPPEVYMYSDTTLTRRGPLSDYVVDGTVIPKPEQAKLPSIERHETDKKSGSAIGSFLGDALKCIGITSAPKLDLSFTNGYDITFSFDDVTSESVDSSKIDKLRSSLDMSAIPKEQIQAGYLHIAYEYVYAGQLSMRAVSGGSSSFNAKAIQIGAYVDLGVKGTAEWQNETTLAFKSTDGVSGAFACRIGQLEKRGKTWYFHPNEDQGQSFLADEAPAKPYLLERGVVLRAEDSGTGPTP